MYVIPKDSPNAQRAIDEMNRHLGADIRVAMSDDWWDVRVENGLPLVHVDWQKVRTAMSQYAENEVISKASPVGRYAVAEMNHNLGYDIREVFSDEWWHVRLRNGEPDVLLNEQGVRAMAMNSPRPDAASRNVENILAGRDPRAKPIHFN